MRSSQKRGGQIKKLLVGGGLKLILYLMPDRAGCVNV